MRGTLRILLFAFLAGTLSAADEKPAEAQHLFVALQFPQQFYRERQMFLRMLEDKGRSSSYINWISTQIDYAKYEGPMCSYIASRFTQVELLAINAYLASSGGRREFAELRAMAREMDDTTATEDIDARWKRFNNSLSYEERKSVTDFHNTNTGRKYWATLPSIDVKSRGIFDGIIDGIGRPDPSQEAPKPKVPPTHSPEVLPAMGQ